MSLEWSKVDEALFAAAPRHNSGTLPITFFNQLPGVAEKAPAQHVPAPATAQGGARAYVTQSSRGTWLYQPHEGGGTNG